MDAYKRPAFHNDHYHTLSLQNDGFSVMWKTQKLVDGFMIFGTEFWSAILGAVVGGLMALLIQIRTLHAAKNERISKKSERREALGHSIMFKALRINANLYDFHLHMEECFSAVDPDLHSEPWKFISFLTVSRADVCFSTDEMFLVFSIKESELFDKLMSLDVNHNYLIDVFKTYTDKREDMLALMPTEVKGKRGMPKLTDEQRLVVGPKIVVLNQLLAGARINVKDSFEKSKEVIEYLAKALNEQLGLELKVEIKAEEIAALAEVTKQR